MVIWIIGLSGSGKTTLANLVVNRLRKVGNNIVLLDGDVIRDLFANDVDHTIDGRRRNAERLSKLSYFLSKQNVHVVAAVLSIFPEWQSWNRDNISDYREVYLKASIETLLKRDNKDLYKRAFNAEISNVVGVDIPFPEPENPDLILENEMERDKFDDMINSIMSIDVIRNILPSE